MEVLLFYGEKWKSSILIWRLKRRDIRNGESTDFMVNQMGVGDNSPGNFL